jgi:hypothetical protein
MSSFNDKPTELESDLQSKVIEFAEIRGWICVKIVCESRRGWMDLYALRKGRHVWMEAKRLGEEERLQQAKRIREVKAQGGEVYVVDTLDRAREILR